MSHRLFTVAALVAALLALAPAAILRARAPVPVVPVDVRHVFGPPGAPGDRVSIYPTVAGGAVLLTHPPSPSGTQIWLVSAQGEARLLREFPVSDPLQPWELSPAPDGGFFGIAFGSGPPDYGHVLHVALDGTIRPLYAYRNQEDGFFPTAVRLGANGATYVSSRLGTSGFPQLLPASVLVIAADGTIVPNAFTAPGPILAVDASGVAYGLGPPDFLSLQTTLFRRRTDGVIEPLRRLDRMFADLAVSPSGVLVGAGAASDFFSCDIFRFEGTYQLLAEYPVTTGEGTVCEGRVQWDAANERFVGVAGGMVFAVSTTGSLSPVRTFRQADGWPRDVTPMPSGGTWMTVSGAGIYNSGCATTTAVMAVDAAAPLRVVASLPAGTNAEGADLDNRPFVLDPDGSLYGVAGRGGTFNAGTVYRVARDGSFSRLYMFTCGQDGGLPAGLVRTSTGALFGTTARGAGHSGTVFEVGRSGNLQTRFVFRRAEDGGTPGPLAAGRDGAVYGWTTSGGLYGGGTAFRVSAAGEFRKLHDFGPADGLLGSATGAPVAAGDGFLYGVSWSRTPCFPSYQICSSVLFRLSMTGDVTVLDNGSPAGLFPLISATLVEGSDGRVYGSRGSDGFAVTGRGELSLFPGQAGIQAAGVDGGLYGRTDRDFFRMTTSGLVMTFTPSQHVVDYTTTAQSRNDQVCMSGAFYSSVSGESSVLFCVPVLGPMPPGRVRIAR